MLSKLQTVFLRGRYTNIYNQTQVSQFWSYILCLDMLWLVEILCILFKDSGWQPLVWKTYLHCFTLSTMWFRVDEEMELGNDYSFYSCSLPRVKSLTAKVSETILTLTSGLGEVGEYVFFVFPFYFSILFCFLLEANRVASQCCFSLLGKWRGSTPLGQLVFSRTQWGFVFVLRPSNSLDL